jgi:pimeloyl-ACP methyl ester carboxylesterase
MIVTATSARGDRSGCEARRARIEEAGHLPHLEQPERVLDAIRHFADATTRAATT